MTLILHPRIQAKAHPDLPAQIVAETGEVISFGELEENANQAAHLFQSWGLLPGDVIVLFADNHSRYLEVCWACQRSGLYYIPLSWHFTLSEVSYVVTDSGAKAALFAPQFAGIANELAAAVPSIRVLLLDGPHDGHLQSYVAARSSMPRSPIDEERTGSDMMYTSGTTGQPKGVRAALPEERSVEEAPPHYSLYADLGYRPGAVHFSAGPLYHASPLRTAMMAQSFGSTVILSQAKFDPEGILGIIQSYQVTHSNWVPTHFIRLLKLDQEVRKSYDIRSLELVLHGAAPCPIPVKQQMIDWLGPIIVEYYGGTEEFGSCWINTHEWLRHKGSVGRPTARPVHILNDETFEELPRGEIGTIYFENPRDTSYHNAPEKTRMARSPQGWATFGDIGTLDADGYLYLVDRKADMIISGGVNIYPQEAEQRLVTHSKVADVAVFGIPNEDFGEEVKAVVQPVDWADAGQAFADELIAYCRKTLSPIKCPRSIDFIPSLPRAENGKLYKRVLKEAYKLAQPA